MNIVNYDDSSHRNGVVGLWDKVFGYADSRNCPSAVIDKKLAAGDGLFLVAVESGRVTGTIMAGYDGHRGWIYSLAVAPEQRLRKIGCDLLSSAENALIQKGCMKINLQILSSNKDVQDFYEKNGYIAEERISMGKEIPGNIPALELCRPDIRQS